MFQHTTHPLKARVLAMMLLRVVFALAFLGITTWIQLRETSYSQVNFYPLYGVVVTVGLLTIGYALALNWVRNLQRFTYLQVSVDIALVTVIVYITGGTESYLSTLYLLSVIGSTILLRKPGGFYAASASSIAYGVLVDMDFYGMLPESYKAFAIHSPPAWEDVLATVATNILAFFTVAYLTGYLAERNARMERQLEEKEIDFEKLEALNRQVVENITSGIMTLDPDDRITSFNRAAENVTGYTLKEVYGRHVDDIFPGMLQTGVEALRKGLRVEKRFKGKTNQLYLGYTISEGREGDVSTIVIFQDLTQLKSMEEQLRRDEKLKALGELSVGIAHEIRNPLASISGSVQVLREELTVDGENTRLMGIVLREAERLNALITDFLLFAKPARGNRERVDLGGVIESMVDMFKNSPQADGIDLKTDIGYGLMIEADIRQIGQVFWNLLLNAAHAMEGEGSIKLSARPDYPEGGGRPAVEVKIADNGTGIAPEDIGRIFDPFFTTKDSGTGLGLAIVHRIVESHGGSVKVASSTDGTVFKILLPMAAEEASRDGGADDAGKTEKAAI